MTRDRIGASLSAKIREESPKGRTKTDWRKHSRFNPHGIEITSKARLCPGCSYRASEAKSARRDRSPRLSVMWPAWFQLLKRSTAKVRPEVVSVR